MRGAIGRRRFLSALGVAAVAGCVGGPQAEVGGAPSPTATRTPSPTRTEAPDRQVGEAPPTVNERLPLPLEPSAIREAAVSGGPRKDGIPSIDDPVFRSAAEADDDLQGEEPVFGLAMAGEAKAYPQSILVWHEICNDSIGSRPVGVTYCPLTGTVMGFDRGGTTFGVSGRLVNNNLIMYDRATETWWPQVLATAVPGPWNEDPPIRSLAEFRIVWTTWGRWRESHPETRVLSRDTGYARNYDRDPYGSYNPLGGYYRPQAAPMFPTLSEDDRLPPKTVVMGVRTGDSATAFLKDRLRRDRLIEGDLGGLPVVAVYDAALDTGYVYRNPDGVALNHRGGTVIVDGNTAHPPDGLPIERVLAFDAMWFAWSGFYPDTTLHG